MESKPANKYYEAPSDEIFEEIKSAAIKIWQTYDNEFGYVDEKVGRIKDINNVSDNAMYMVAMFDMFNQTKLLNMISQEAADFIRDRTSC